jgi:hypothetical protein
MLANSRPAHHLTVVLAALLFWAQPLFAQDRPAPAFDLAAGWAGFADDGIVSEVPIGGAFRFYLSPRVSIGPEVTLISGDSHAHQVVTGNLTFDFRAPRNGIPVVTPFVVVGGGMFRTSEGFADRPPFSATEGAFTVGGGIRAPLGDRVSGGIDARLGWEAHLRLTGFVSVSLGANP